jgi:hypothetical protein
MDRSTKIYIALVIAYALTSALTLYLPQGIDAGSLPTSRPVVASVIFFGLLIVYGGLGFLGLFLARKVGFADLWDKKVTNRQRFIVPLAWGIGCGLTLIILDQVFALYIGHLPHPSFPLSIVASFTAGIGEEIMFRLFYITLWVWIISLIVRNRWKETVFWIVTVCSALIFALSHLPTLMVLYGVGNPFDILPLRIVEVIILNSIVSIPAAYYLRKYGFLAAVGIHFWTDIVWHVIYGVL